MKVQVGERERERERERMFGHRYCLSMQMDADQLSGRFRILVAAQVEAAFDESGRQDGR